MKTLFLAFVMANVTPSLCSAASRLSGAAGAGAAEVDAAPPSARFCRLSCSSRSSSLAPSSLESTTSTCATSAVLITYPLTCSAWSRLPAGCPSPPSPPAPGCPSPPSPPSGGTAGRPSRFS